MTSVAKFVLSEKEATALVDAIDGEEVLSALSVSRDESSDQRWKVQIYLSGEQDNDELTTLRRLSVTVLGSASAKFKLEKLPDIDWVAKSLEG